MILGLQIVAIFFAFSMIYLALLNYRRGEIDKGEFISWTVIWTLTIFIVIFPEILRNLAQRFFITRLFDLMVVGGFILVIAMVSRNYVRGRRVEKKIEDLIRKETLRDIKRGKKRIK